MDLSQKVGVFGSLAVLLGAGLFDWALELGRFSGLVFLLYSAYGLGALLLGLLVTAFFRGRGWLFAALWPAGGLVVLWLVGTLVG